MRIAVAGATGTSGRLVMAELARRGIEAVPISRVSGVDLLTGVQPVAAAAVATVLADHAVSAAPPAMIQVGGPERMRLSELTTAVLRQAGDDRPVIAIEPPTPEMLTGVLLPPHDALIIGPTAAEWLRP